MTASSIGLSRLLEKDEPASAIALFPLNAEARIRAITDALNATGGDPDLALLQRESRRALRYDAGDARLYSLLGEIDYQGGNRDEAYRLFERARKFSKTEIHALQRTIVHAIELDDLAKAVREADILLRRWPEKLDAMAASFPLILAKEEGYAAILAALKAEAPWRSSLFSALAKDPRGIAAADRLLLDLKRSDAPPRQGELASVIVGYIAQKRYEAAYHLFLFTLSEEEKKLGGYVFNGRFAPLRTHRPFDWQIRDQPGLEVTFAEPADERGSGGGANVRFLNKPVKNVSLQQFIQLPPGGYLVTLNASGRNLKLPKELFWSLRCVDSNTELLRLAIPEGSFDARLLSAKFTVDPGGCAMQILKLETALIAESWRYRYVGTVTMHDIRIERLAS